jgi:hypothetical protein
MTATPPCVPSPPVLAAGRSASLKQWAVIGGILGTASLVLYFFDPARFGFYPRCPLHEFTGLACPGCGALRAVHQLLHGRIWAAFKFNPLLVSVLPFVLWQMGKRVVRDWQGLPTQDLFRDPRSPWLALGALIGFAVLRNLPFFPFPKV